MRRLFHGRMITVDGHMRRMSENYNKFAIFPSDNIGYIFENKSWDGAPVTGGTINWISNTSRLTQLIPISTGKFTVICDSRYETYVAFFDAAGKYTGYDLQWTADKTFTMSNPGYLYLSIRNKANPSTRLYVGDCGVIITEE